MLGRKQGAGGTDIDNQWWPKANGYTVTLTTTVRSVTKEKCRVPRYSEIRGGREGWWRDGGGVRECFQRQGH